MFDVYIFKFLNPRKSATAIYQQEQEALGRTNSPTSPTCHLFEVPESN
jgi:hypothetical protein